MKAYAAAAVVSAVLAFGACQPARPAPDNLHLNVAVDTNGKIFVNGKEMTEEQLDALLKVGEAEKAGKVEAVKP